MGEQVEKVPSSEWIQNIIKEHCPKKKKKECCPSKDRAVDKCLKVKKT